MVDWPDGFSPGPRGCEQVLYGLHDGLGAVLLNRPRALNALTEEMVDDLAAQLEVWSRDPEVAVVSFEGAGGRALCAGGDIKAMRELVLTDSAAAADFWSREYDLDLAIATFPKPTVAFMDGYVMGGGLGVSAFATHRWVAPDARLAMPETIIGFFPDVGSSHLLARAPGELGTYAAMTGNTIGPADAVLLGLADRVLPTEAAPAARGDLRAGLPPTEVAQRHTIPAPEAPLASAAWIDECFAGDDASVIADRLADHAAAEARACAAELRSRSPIAVAVTLERVRRAASEPTVADSMDVDRGLARRFMDAPDFAEGVRARVIDKDNTPRWAHARLEDVSREEVLAFFER